jgi:hypothetical protein
MMYRRSAATLLAGMRTASSATRASSSVMSLPPSLHTRCAATGTTKTPVAHRLHTSAALNAASKAEAKDELPDATETMREAMATVMGEVEAKEGRSNDEMKKLINQMRGVGGFDPHDRDGVEFETEHPMKRYRMNPKARAIARGDEELPTWIKKKFGTETDRAAREIFRILSDVETRDPAAGKYDDEAAPTPAERQAELPELYAKETSPSKHYPADVGRYFVGIADKAPVELAAEQDEELWRGDGHLMLREVMFRLVQDLKLVHPGENANVRLRRSKPSAATDGLPFNHVLRRKVGNTCSLLM